MGTDQVGAVLGRESEEAARTWTLRLPTKPIYRDPMSIVRPSLDGLFLAAEQLFEPLELMVNIGWLDITHGYFHSDVPRRMEWKLEVRQLPTEMHYRRSWPVSGELEQVDRLVRTVAEDFVARACAQTGEPDAVACPSQMWFSATRARLLEPMPRELERLVLDRDVGPGSLPIQRDEEGSWVTGPQSGFTTTPVTAEVGIHATELEIRLCAHWSLWMDDDCPGTAAVERSVRRLEQNGWRRVG